MRQLKADRFSIGSLVLLWALFYWRFLTPVAADRVTFPSGDFTQQFFAYRSLAFRQIVTGHLPLWEPCLYSGYPFQADPQSQLFYPPVAAELWLGRALGWPAFPLRALEWEVLLHSLLVALLTYAFLRGQVRPLAALFGAVVFAFGGYLTSYPPLQTAILESVTWLPLALLGLRQFADGRPRGLVLAAVALGLSGLAGHPQTFFLILVLSLAYVGFLFAFDPSVRNRGRGRMSRVVFALSSIGAGVGLAAIQLLPTIEFMRLSTRRSLGFDQAATGFPAQDVIQFFVTGLVSHWQPLYVGILTLALAALAITSAARFSPTTFPISRFRFRSHIGFWLVVVLTGLIFSLGQNAFGFDLVYWLFPGYSLFRDQERHALWVSFGLAVLGALGFECMLQPLSRRARQQLSYVVRALVWLTPLVALALFIAILLSRLVRDVSDSGELPARLGITLLATVLSASVLTLRLGPRRVRIWVGVLAMAVLVLDLFSVNRRPNQSPPFDPFPPQPALAVLPRAFRGLDSTPPFRLQDDFRLPGNAACLAGYQQTGGISPIELATYRAFQDQLPERTQWRLLSVGAVVTWRGSLVTREGQAVPAELLYHAGEGQDVTYTYRLLDPPVWAWVVRDVNSVADEATARTLVARPEFDPNQQAVVTGSPGPFSQAAEADTIQPIQRDPDEIQVQVRLTKPGLLIISEIAYPGWQVTVDGQPAIGYTVDGLLRGVALPAGDSQVRWHYEPSTFRWGAIGTGLSSFFLFVVYWLNVTL